ncbi:MAG TPA: ATP-binding protein [Spirochaetia bacterium]|nr:ATP-binding protein [Spirochaetia bacterium]
MIVIFRGLPGVGKSYLAHRLLQRRPDMLVLSRDSLRTSIITRPTFSEEEKSFVDDLIVSMARWLLGHDRSVVIDGMALSSAKRLEDFAAAAVSQRKSLRIIECVCSEATALARLRADAGDHPAGDRSEGLYRRVKERFEETELPYLRVDTEGDAEENLQAILGYIENPPP